MFPPLVMIPAGLIGFSGLWFGLQALDGRAPLRLDARALLGAASTILFSLLLRVYDELKDLETDVRLGRAGDPRYRDRAIVTGHVLAADIVALRNGVIVALLAINLGLSALGGWPWSAASAALPLTAFAVALALAWLSSRWFFWPAVSRHLLLAFVTHNPLSLVLTGYGVVVYLADTGERRMPDGTLGLALGMWLQVAAWEIARKVRRPSEETAYMTYSKVLGWRPAALLPLLLCGASAGCLTWVARRVALGPWLPGALGAAVLLMGLGTYLYLRSPRVESTKLRVMTEIYALVASAGLPLALALRFKVALGGSP